MSLDLEGLNYSPAFERLSEQLAAVDRPGNFVAHGTVTVPMPRLDVDDIGIVSFPVPPEQVRSLIAMAEPAPYGKGPLTVVDENIRNCRQISPDLFRIGGKTWPNTLVDIGRSVSSGLGFGPDELELEPYKMLLYEAGGFFTSHRDTEKADGMVATLVVALPVSGQGGELAIRHLDEETVVDMATDDPSELAYAAFYADCEHEVRPISKGNRICLVYNVLVRNREHWAERRFAPDYQNKISDVAATLAAWPLPDSEEQKIVWLLEHEYSQAGLSFATLKNTDAARARVLLQASRRSDHALFASIVHIVQEDSIDYFGGSGYYRGYGHRDEIIDADGENYELVETIDRQVWVDTWVDPDGTRPAYGKLPVILKEILPIFGLDGAKPDEEKIFEATGNEGATLERVYRRAALVLWPKAGYLDVLASGSIVDALTYLEQTIDRNTGSEEDRRAFLTMAARLTDLWPARIHPSHQSDPDHSPMARALRLLGRIGERSVTIRFLRERVMPHYRRNLNDPMVALADGLDAAEYCEYVTELAIRHGERRVTAVLELLLKFSDHVSDAPSGVWHKSLTAAAKLVCTTLVQPAPDQPPPEHQLRKQEATPKLGSDGVTILLQLAWRFDLEREATAVARVIVDRPGMVRPDDVLPLCLENLYASGNIGHREPFGILWVHAAGFLLDRSAETPAPPSNWTVPSAMSCQCASCKAVQDFCRHPVANERDFRINEQLRSHVIRQIRIDNLDLMQTTIKSGRPYSLRCTKTRASSERRLKEYKADIKSMKRLFALSRAVPAENLIAANLRDAIKRSTHARTDPASQ